MGSNGSDDDSLVRDVQLHLDLGSRLVIVVTGLLFVAALYVHGVGRGLLLEAAVFLVSVKLILMAYKNSQVARNVSDRLDRMEATLRRIERVVGEKPDAGAAPPADAVVPKQGTH